MTKHKDYPLFVTFNISKETYKYYELPLDYHGRQIWCSTAKVDYEQDEAHYMGEEFYTSGYIRMGRHWDSLREIHRLRPIYFSLPGKPLDIDQIVSFPTYMGQPLSDWPIIVVSQEYCYFCDTYGCLEGPLHSEKEIFGTVVERADLSALFDSCLRSVN